MIIKVNIKSGNNNLMQNIYNFFRKNSIGEPPWDYYFLKNLDEKEYPIYLAKLFYLNTGEKLPLKYDFKNRAWIIDKKKCKTFNQKIQWLKLYDATDLKRRCTDKVAVRDYVAEKIGSEYLKPVLQVIPSLNCDCHVIANHNSTLGDESITDFNTLSHSEPDVNSGVKNFYNSRYGDVTTYFDQIDWEKLPNAFVIKCNHGCKWQYIIKDKEAFLKNKRLFDIVKHQMTGWLEQDYSFWSGFEMQYLTSRRVESPNSTLRVRTRLCDGIACGNEKFAECEGIFFAEKNSGKENPKSRLSQIFQESDNEASDLPDTKRIIEPIGEINEPVYSNKYGLRQGCQDGIEPKILIESLLRENINKNSIEINVYCFNSSPTIFIKFFGNKMNIWDSQFRPMRNIFKFIEINEKSDCISNIKQTFDLHIEEFKNLNKKLSENFLFVRIDWLVFKNKLYFEEMTFTPHSGYFKFLNDRINKDLGKLINIGE